MKGEKLHLSVDIRISIYNVIREKKITSRIVLRKLDDTCKIIKLGSYVSPIQKLTPNRPKT